MANIAIINYCNLRCPFCLDGDTNILMADGSSKKIKDISKGDVVIGFQEFVEKNKQRQISPTTVSSDLMIHTESDYYKITLDNGLSLKITGNHPILNGRNKWVKVQDLRPKTQKVKSITNLQIENDYNYANTLDYKKGYFTAMWLTDGCFQHYSYEQHGEIYFMRLAVNDREIINRMTKYCDLFLGKNRYQIRDFLMSDKIQSFVPAIFAHQKHCYDIINNMANDFLTNQETLLLNTDYVRGFLAACYDAEGHIDRDGKVVSITNTNLHILSFWERGLKALGFDVKRDKSSQGINKPVYRSRIVNSCMHNAPIVFFQNVFPAVNRKCLYLKQGFSAFQNITIASIEHIKEPLEVYNFETESHTYVANGIAVHNCFADDMIQEETQVISIEDYQKMLLFLAKTPHNHVGIIGGEPTLHPRLEEILKETNKYCRECNTDATLFTNGIELEKFLPYFGERIHLLINYTNPDDMTAEQRKKRTHCLDQLFDLCWFDQKASCGINIHPGCVDYSWFWEMVDRYHLNHVRCSVVSPAAKYECWRSDKEGYYTMMKPIFIDFCRQAIQHNCRLGMDCGHIPTCYFTAEEKEIVYSICDNVDQDWCEPVVDIKPDFKATACFGSYDPIDIRDFNDLFELERYLSRKKSLPRAELNCAGRCSTCKKHKLLQCQGGCLGFAEVL